jgi:hypothetical protein
LHSTTKNLSRCSGRALKIGFGTGFPYFWTGLSVILEQGFHFSGEGRLYTLCAGLSVLSEQVLTILEQGYRTFGAGLSVFMVQVSAILEQGSSAL